MHVHGNFNPALSLISQVANGHSYLSFSQFGEDRLIDVFFHGMSTPGFYVDVGAHHPERFSNTHLLHHRGWRGINIDGDPSNIELFKNARPNDINLSAFVSDQRKTVTFNRFSDTAVNTISAKTAAHYEKFWTIISRTSVETCTLAEVLENYLPQGQEIDFLSVDVEGVDLEVLSGNDWNKFRPRLVIVEAEGLDLARAAENDVVGFMISKNYRLTGFMHVSAFFVRD